MELQSNCNAKNVQTGIYTQNPTLGIITTKEQRIKNPQCTVQCIHPETIRVPQYATRTPPINTKDYISEEHAREQIWKLNQTRNVNNYIYHFREVQNEIPSMNSAKACSLFMDGMNLELHQLVGTLITSGNLDEVIEVVKKATMYGEDKGFSSQTKTETNKNSNMEMEKGPREEKGRGDLVRVIVVCWRLALGFDNIG